MATPKINENCHYVQNDPHKGKIKLEKFDFDILCRFEDIKESLPGGRIPPPPPGEVGLKCFKCATQKQQEVLYATYLTRLLGASGQQQWE